VINRPWDNLQTDCHFSRPTLSGYVQIFLSDTVGLCSNCPVTPIIGLSTPFCTQSVDTYCVGCEINAGSHPAGEAVWPNVAFLKRSAASGWQMIQKQSSIG
jgi:hypothetical protein